nr:DUF3147 family protein [Pseudonocardia acidicola]
MALKTVASGLFVAAFAVVASMLSPKRLAGVFAAAPAVALGSLIMTVALLGNAGAVVAARGMAVGGAGFAVSCAAAVPALRRWGVLRGTAMTIAVWAVVSAVLYRVVRP